MPNVDYNYGYRAGGSGRGSKSSSSGGGNPFRNLIILAQRSQARKKAAAEQQYLDALGSALGGGQQQGGGGGGYSYSGGGGGGGGGGPSAYDSWRIAEEKRRREELERQKRALELGLAGQKKAAVPRLKQYGKEARQRVMNVYAQNAQQTGEYSKQLRQLGDNMRGGAMIELAGLNRDMASQGGGGADMRALQAAANQNVTGMDFLQNNADSFNRRLAQVQSGARADSLSTANNVEMAGLGDLENNYLQALMQIRLLGLVS